MKIKTKYYDLLNTFIIVIICSVSLYAQTNDTLKTKVFNREALLNDIMGKILDNYIFLDVAAKIDSTIRFEIKRGKYNNLTNHEFAEALSKDLRAFSKDKHFFVKYVGNQPITNKLNSKEQQELDNYTNSLENYGFENVSRLKGNIGYINYKGFAEPKSSKIALESTMNFVSNSNSLIIDLRENRGGDGNMMLLFCSYFFDKKIKISETYFRFNDKTIQNWTKEKVSGKKYLNRNIYFLTSKNTFSAAEALSYTLHNYNIAKVIGEKTGGAANPVDGFLIANEYLLLIPIGKEINVITKANWEHIGVIPDENIKSKDALTTAHILALEDILKKKTRTELTMDEIEELIKQLKYSLAN